MGQRKLTPDAGNNPQLIQAGGNTHRIVLLLGECEALRSQLLKRYIGRIVECQVGCRIQRSCSQWGLYTNTRSQRLHQEGQPFFPISTMMPERQEGDTQAQGTLDLSYTFQ